MDNSTNSSKATNFVESNKKLIDISFLIVILLILFTTFATAKNRANQYNKYKRDFPFSIGVESGLVQRKMTYNENGFQQKYLELVYRVNLSKKFTQNLSAELSVYNSLTNTAPNFNYTYSDNNTIISFAGIYTIRLLPNVNLEPKIGYGWMQYHEHKNVISDQQLTKKNQSQMLQIGGRLKYHFNKNISFGTGLEVMYTNKQNYIPFAYGGIYISFLKSTNNFLRKCPSRF